MPRRRSRECPPGCFPFNRLPVDSYFMRCGKITEERRRRGEPVSAYKKVKGPYTARRIRYEGGVVEMLLKARGWGAAKRVGGMSAPYYPMRDNPCVRKLGRDWAIRFAEQRAKFALARARKRARRVA